MGPMGMYLIFGRNGTQLGGMFDKGSQGKPGSAYWLGYVSVDDVEGAIERAKAARGSVLTGPMDVPGGDRVAQLMDPHGAFFALHMRAGTAKPAAKASAPAKASKPAKKAAAANKKAPAPRNRAPRRGPRRRPRRRKSHRLHAKRRKRNLRRKNQPRVRPPRKPTRSKARRRPASADASAVALSAQARRVRLSRLAGRTANAPPAPCHSGLP
jgi:hypothetical protein